MEDITLPREISNIVICETTDEINTIKSPDNINGRTNLSDTSFMDKNKLMLLNAKRLREKVIIYEFMCYRTAVFYTRLNKVILYPSICISSLIALLNSNLGTDKINPNSIQMVNVVGNSLLTLMLTLKSTLKHAEKADYFFNMKKKFTSLHNKLNTELIDREISETQLELFMHEYDNLDENIVYQFPDRIIQDVKEKFIGCSFPTICNGIETSTNPNSKSKKYSIPDVV